VGRTPDLTKYVEAGDHCPFCGAGPLSSWMASITFYGPEGQWEARERWSCDACCKEWDAIFKFDRLEVIE
jgi:hypothetical protein